MAAASPYPRFLKSAVLLAAGLAGLAVAVNALVDPYWLLDTPRRVGINFERTEMNGQERLFKPYHVTRLQPRSLIIGASRAEIGLSPDHPALAQPAYNMGVLGANIRETALMFRHAVAVAPVRQAVLTLDFFSFNAHAPDSPNFDEGRLAVSGHSPSLLHDLPVLLSWDTVQASIKTLDNQRRKKHSAFSENGLREWASKGKVTVAQAFAQAERDFMGETLFPAPMRAFCLSNERGDSMEAFRLLLREAHHNDVDLRLATPPVHARLIHALHISGLGPAFSDWKRRLVRVNAEEAAAAGRQPFPLWDFSAPGGFTAEPLPEADHGEMRWYWEASHFKTALGDRMLDRMFELPGDGQFGVALTVEDIERRIGSFDAAYRQWLDSRGDDARAVEAGAPSARPRTARCGT